MNYDPKIPVSPADRPESERARTLMVQNQLASRGIQSQSILDAFQKVTRHLFVKPEDIGQAYEDHPLSIGFGQTISQPYMVAYMLEALDLRGGEKILEIGTGSGYQTALLAEISAHVYTVERIPELLKSAQTKLDYRNISFQVRDGTLGWPEMAPFDRIIVSAGSPKIPEKLIEQLKDKGIMVIPVGNEFHQDLFRVVRQGDQIIKERKGGCVFVKLIGQEGWQLD
ncbi:MAG: protein-L-isoaspartate(D-aspartate) O-methyltransferase [Planctomycetes bacterium]|nr:protein-L-isoaspartate(D-aspartate) O-methyltransferase [Planctomycetota bacterium]MCK5579245.1 protein-L-isoaspartate(D-aspartate) O-methyltransferase [Planctomycetota bacterium]